MSTSSGGHRATGRRRTGRVEAAVVAAVLAVTAGAVALQRQPDDPTPSTHTAAPREEPVTSWSLGCPGGPGASRLVVARTGDEAELSRRPAASDESVPLSPDGDGTLRVGPTADQVVDAEGPDAGTVAAARVGEGPPAASPCAPVADESWYAGIGVGGLHESRLTLMNPDAGPAVAELTFYGPDGEVVPDGDHAFSLDPQRKQVIDLGRVVPGRRELTMRVSVTRGRLISTVRDTYTPQAGGAPSADGLAATAEPATDLFIPGVPRDADEQVLVLTNPGPDEGRVQVRLIGKDSEFSPSGLAEIRVPAGSTTVTDIGPAISDLVADEDTTLKLVGTEPVAATLRSVVADDLVQLPAVAASDQPLATAVPGGPDSVLLLTASQRAAVARVRYLGGGEPWRGRLRPGRTVAVPVPEGADALVLEAPAPVTGAVRTVTSEGASLLPLRPVTTERLVPQVHPDWP